MKAIKWMRDWLLIAPICVITLFASIGVIVGEDNASKGHIPSSLPFPSSGEPTVGAKPTLEAKKAAVGVSKTYTPAQLRSMITSGKYPEQGSPTTQTKSVDYALCIAQIEAVVLTVGSNYPARTLVSTNIFRMDKVWVNDAAMTLSCSASDKKLIITSSRYE